MLYLKTALGLVRQQRRAVSLACFVVFLLSVAASMLQITRMTYFETITQTGSSSIGGYQFRVGATTQQALDELRSAANSSAELIAIRKAYPTIAADGQSASLDGFSAAGEFRFGQLVSGRFPLSPGEVTLSLPVAKRLGLGLDDSTTVDGKPAKIVGISVWPSGIDFEYLVSFATKEVAADFDQWVTNADLEQDPRFSEQTRAGHIRISSVDMIIAQNLETARNGIFGIAGYLETAFIIAFGVTLSMIFIMLARASAPVRTALDAIAMRKSRVALITFGPLCAPPIFSALAGTLTAIIGSSLSASYLGELLNQYWATTSGNIGQKLLPMLEAFALAGCVAAAQILIALRPRRSRPSTLARPTTALWAGIITLTCGAAFLILNSEWLYFAGVIFLIVGISFISCFLSWLLVRDPLRTAGYNATNILLFSLPFTAITLAAGSILAINFGITANLASKEYPNADTYLTVGFLSQRDIDYLAQSFPEVMDTAIVISLADESEYLTQIATRDNADCQLSASRSGKDPFLSCQVGTQTNIGFIDPDGNGAELIGRGSPELIEENPDKNYAIIRYDGSVSKLHDSTPIELPGTVDYRLDNYHLPGWIVDPENPTIKQLGIVPGIDRRLFIPDFQTNSENLQARFLRAAASVSKSVAIDQNEGLSSGSLHQLGLLITLSTAILSIAMLALGTTAIRKADQSLITTMLDNGASRKQLRLIRLCELLPYLLTIPITLAITKQFARPVASARIITNIGFSDAGITWLIGPTLFLITCLTIILLTDTKPKKKSIISQEE